MTADEASGPPAASDLPEPVREWLSRIAAERGVPEEELLAWLLPSTERPDAADGTGFAGSLDPGGSASIEEDLGALEDRLDRRIDEIETEFGDKLADVRERVVQVKRETDSKAPDDHDHADLASDLERALSELEDLRAAVEDLDDRTERGFENYQSVLDYLTETTDDLAEKLTSLASAVLDVRDRVDDIADAESRRAAAAELARSANEQGVTGARCEDCEEPVEIALLRAPRCPHCDATFSELEPRRSFFGHSTLRTGAPPALESGDAAGPGLESVLDADESDDDPGAPDAPGEGFDHVRSRGDATGKDPTDDATVRDADHSSSP